MGGAKEAAGNYGKVMRGGWINPLL
jgi:hypothetical protein